MTGTDKPSISRGLDAILKLHEATYQDLQSNKVSHDGELKEIQVDMLQPGMFQPRKNFHEEDLELLANSIVSQGIIQPLIVRQINQNTYEIIAGERRWRAAKMAGLNNVPVVIRNIEDEVAAAFSLIENIQRKDLNPLEEALALQRLIDEFNLSHDEVAQNIGRSRTAVTNILRLLSLGEEVKSALTQGIISMGHARALVTLDATKQRNICKKIVMKHLSVRQTEQLARSFVRERKNENNLIKSAEELLTSWSYELKNKLNTNTHIRQLSDNHFHITMKVKSREELNRLVSLLLSIKN